MTQVATIYGAVPENVPHVPVSVVLPLPAGHGLTFGNDTKASPVSIYTEDVDGEATPGALPTEFEVLRYRPNGQPATVRLFALATQAQAAAGLTVTDDPSPASDGSLELPAALANQVFSGAIKFRVEGVDGTYEASIVAPWSEQAVMVGKSHLRMYVRANVMPVDAECKLPHFGFIEGFVTIYSGVDVADFDLIWLSGDVQQPIGVCHFNEVELVMGAGFYGASKSPSPYHTPGAGTAKLVKPIEGGGSYPLIPGRAKVLRFSVFAGDEPLWSADWLERSAFSTSAIDADVDEYNALNTTTPIDFHLAPMPALHADAVAAAIADQAAFLEERQNLTAHNLAGGDTEQYESGWRHRVFPKYGGWGSGGYLHHWPAWDHVVSNSGTSLRYLWAMTEGTLDRVSGFFSRAGTVLDPFQYQADTGKTLDLSLNMSGMGSTQKTASWVGTNDPWGYSSAPENAPPGTSGEREATERKWGEIDAQHGGRLWYSINPLVQHYGDPLARLLLRYLASMLMCDRMNLGGTNGPAQGISGGRGEAWAAGIVSLAMSYTKPNAQPSSWYAHMKGYVQTFYTALRNSQLPNGGFLAWTSKGNKEYTKMLDDVYAEQYALKATELGFDIEGLDAEQIEALLGDRDKAQAQAAATKYAVAQVYQENIVAVNLWAVGCATGADVTFMLLRHGYATGILYWGQNNAEPWYRVGVYDQAKPNKVFLAPEEIEQGYNSEKYPDLNTFTSHHVPAELWVTYNVAATWNLSPIVLSLVDRLNANLLTEAAQDREKLYNAEPLLRLLQALEE